MTDNGNGDIAKDYISIRSQESNYTAWRLSKMKLAIRGFDCRIANVGSFRDYRRPDFKANIIFANPPFHVSD